jgi:hypothetical protein
MSLVVRLNRKGATLPLTIIVLALMAVGIAITFHRISAERHVGGDVRARLGAFSVAQSGLNRFLANLNGKPALLPGQVQTVNYADLPGGSAQVDMVLLRESTNTLLPAVYSITSRGTYTGGRRYNALTPPAERTVGTYALWTVAPLDLDGAFTTLAPGGLRSNGIIARFVGNDRCGAMGAIPGVASPNAVFNGFPENIEGTPAGVADNLGTPGMGGGADQEVDIDWSGILAGTSLPADFTGVWPPATGPNSFANWPVVRYNGDLTMPGSGKGILIVTGNMTWNGTPLKTWEGLILVGGTLTHNGAGNVFGAIITGLNVKTGGGPGPVQEIANGTKRYEFDSCALARAMGHIGSIQRVRNGWTDTWPSY